MATDISSIRTMQDVINVLSVVYFNMNEIERIYYDMFINPTPMDVTFQRYNDEGVLETITLPNRAKASFNILTGEGNPNGVVAAVIGAFYIDISEGSNDLYYKSQGSDAYGWLKILDSANLNPGVDYLTPTGDGSQLTNINASNINSGVLAVGRGGTGVVTISGLVKGNGASAFSAAVDGTDYLGPNSMTGLIAFYPINSIPTGWLRCDGSAYSRTTYAKLFAKIGTTYGAGNGSTTFNVPNLYNHFIRCWDGSTAFNTVQAAQVGGHTHTYSGTTSSDGDDHTHSRGTMDITGSVETLNNVNDGTKGAFYKVASQNNGGWWGAGTHVIADFMASKTWTGVTSKASVKHTHTYSGTTSNNASGAENRVLNKMLIPVIKY